MNPQSKATCHAKALPCVNIIQHSIQSFYQHFHLQVAKLRALGGLQVGWHLQASHQWPPTKSLGSHRAVSAPKADQNKASEVQPAQPHNFRGACFCKDFLWLNTRRGGTPSASSLAAKGVSASRFASNSRLLAASFQGQFDTSKTGCRNTSSKLGSLWRIVLAADW